MAERVLKIWYDKDLDLLEVFWGEQGGYYTGTDNEWVLADVDTEGNFQGFQIEGVTQIGDSLLKIRIPSPEETKPVPNKRP